MFNNNPEENENVLEKYGRNINEEVKKRKIDLEELRKLVGTTEIDQNGEIIKVYIYTPEQNSLSNYIIS